MDHFISRDPRIGTVLIVETGKGVNSRVRGVFADFELRMMIVLDLFVFHSFVKRLNDISVVRWGLSVVHSTTT